MVEGRQPVDFCDVLEQAIEFIKQDITFKEQQIQKLLERIRKLESEPAPDLAQIAELKSDIEDLEHQLESSDRPQLSAFEDEFSASCGPN